MPKVTVIIPTYNRAQRLKEAIGSVMAQTYRDYELIVVDDASTDNTTEIAVAYAIRYHRLEHNHGVSYARNVGINMAGGEYICFLDSDDIWYPTKLEVQVAYMQAHPEVPVTQVQEIWIRNNRRVNPMNKHKKPSGDIFVPSLKMCLVSPSAVMLRSNIFDTVGLFDESLPVCEDYDLWLRISARHPVHLIDEPLIEKRGGHADQLSRKFWGMDRFRVYAMEKFVDDGLPPHYKNELIKELKTKLKVIYSGALRRGRIPAYIKYRWKHAKYSIK